MSSAEIAEHEQLAIGTVKSRVARALAELREVLRHS
jgi:DNA-directed RNA polymerase specialized sigma24 family protein